MADQVIAALIALALSAPPPAQRISKNPDEDAANIRVDARTGEAAWDAVLNGKREVRRYNLLKNRVLRTPKVSGPARSLTWTKNAKTPLINVLTEDGRWALQIKGKEPVAPSAASDLHGAVSPDRKWIVFVSGRSGQGDLYLAGTDKTNQSPRRLSSGGLPDVLPAWSPDGDHLAFVRLTDRGRQLIVMSGVRGTTSLQERVAADEREGVMFLSWRPDGKQIGFFGRDWSVGTSFYTVRPDMGGATKVLGDVEPQLGGPAWLPDGRGGWVALLIRGGRLIAVDNLGEQTVLQTGTFGVREVAAAVVKGRRMIVLTALGLTSEENLTPRYRKVYKWIWSEQTAEK